MKLITIPMHEVEDLVNDILNLASGCECYDEDDTKRAYKDARKLDKWLDKFRVDKIY